jgi:murein DD-endopeptidase MepM/ murein hydrolase activator NlpD
MPFIARPAAGQIIDPAWGTLVADAVVMRFTTAAQRTSQLTAPVPGQLTAARHRPRPARVLDRYRLGAGHRRREIAYSQVTAPVSIVAARDRGVAPRRARHRPAPTTAARHRSSSSRPTARAPRRVAGGQLMFASTDGATDLGLACPASSAAGPVPVHVTRRLTPPAGSHTYRSALGPGRRGRQRRARCRPAPGGPVPAGVPADHPGHDGGPGRCRRGRARPRRPGRRRRRVAPPSRRPAPRSCDSGGATANPPSDDEEMTMRELTWFPLLESYPKTSAWGARVDPITGARRARGTAGVDYGAPWGVPVIAPSTGRSPPATSPAAPATGCGCQRLRHVQELPPRRLRRALRSGG